MATTIAFWNSHGINVIGHLLVSAPIVFSKQYPKDQLRARLAEDKYRFDSMRRCFGFR